MKIGLIAALGAASLLAMACADSPQSPTDPGLTPRTAVITIAACDAAASRAIKAQLSNMLANPLLKTAQSKWAAVENACIAGNPDAANSSLMNYVFYVDSLYPGSFVPPRKGATLEGNFLTHLDWVFPYVGYASPNLPAGITTSGIVAVITPSSTIREYQKAQLGAFELPVQNGSGSQLGHLFAMYPFGAQCLTVDNLKKFGNCVELTAFPAASSFSPGIKVGVCSLDEGLTGRALGLGHEKTGGTEVAGVGVTYPTDCHADINVSSNVTGFDRVLTRLASIGHKTFGIRRAYAADKGLGGIGSTLSPFGILDASIGAATFSVGPQTIGAPPVDEGDITFTDSVTAPGSILVQNTLGNAAFGPLVVLSQGGGACTGCGGLYLRADFFSASTTAADDGVYEVNWRSVQASPAVKGAPFVIRDALGREIATLKYVTELNQNRLYYNGALVGTWSRNVEQTFKVTVDLNLGNTSLQIGPSVVATGVLFADPDANSLASIGAEFGGIDSGIMGWDEISAHRTR
jgi:hypothetical protein